MLNTLKLLILGVALASALVARPARAETIAGRASVIDADTLQINGQRIRILDIDALESRQTCIRPDGSEWRCGQVAALALSDWLGQRTVTCVTDKLDKYARHLAHCAVAGQDVGQWMGEQGWAVPYRNCKCEVIQDAAKTAKAAKLGIWSGTFIVPWEWRAQQATQTTSEESVTQPTVIKPSTVTPTESAGCQIKGNISSKGERIYHVPGGKWYDKTGIDVSKGERWFCTEADARAAGWRKAKQ